MLTAKVYSAPAERERPTARRAGTLAERAQLAAASACVTKRSRPRAEAEQPVATDASASPRCPGRAVLEAERTRLLTRLEENAKILRGLLGTRRAYRLDLANVERLLAALSLPDATA